MDRDEEDAVVAAEDRLGAVAVVDVEIDDGHPLQPELRLRVARRDGDVVDEAESHRPVGERMVAGRPAERETAAVDRLEREPRREERRVEARRPGRCVGIEQRVLLEPVQPLDVGAGVGREHLLDCRPPLDRCRLERRQRLDPLSPLGVEVPGEVQEREARRAQELDDASSPRSFPSTPPSPHSWARSAPRPQCGGPSSNGGSGAVRSIVAIRR